MYSCFLCVLLFSIGIQAESPSLSFIDLIPNIIANARFVQENFIDSTVVFNQTWPLGHPGNTSGSNCSQDLQLLARELTARQTWALKTFDAWGKLPSGVMQGNIYWVGSIYECEHHLRGLNNTVIEQPFRTRSCLIGNGYSSAMRPVYGVCVPQSCTANDIVDYVNRHAIRIPFVREMMHLSNDSVRCLDQRRYDGKAIVTIVLLTLIALLILLATGIHIVRGHEHDLKMDEVPPTAYEPILTRTSESTSIPANSTDEEDENTPLVSQPRRAVHSITQNLVRYCSLMNNYFLLKAENQPKHLACLNGIRVLSLCWVILGHTFVFAAAYSDNVITIFNWSRQLWFQIIVQAVFSIDSFFLLSGLLTAFTFFISKHENERFSIGKFLLNHYVYRYLRYTIFYAIILLIHIALSPYLGEGGPMYPIDGTESSACRRTWWHNLLYINNFFNSADGCMPITWYLAVNMQFHWIAPLFLLAVSWKWFFGMLVVIAFVIVDIVSTAVIVSKNNYDYGAATDYFSNGSNRTHGYMEDVYMKPWCRIAPYAIGLALGHCLYEMYKRVNTLSWESLVPERISDRYRRLKNVLAWTFALIVLALCIFGTYGDYGGQPLTRSARITFLTLSRLGWAIGLSVIIIACFVGHGGVTNKLLSHPIVDSLAKLTYGAYLWHSLVLFVNYFGREQPTHYTVANILFNCVIHIILSYILSFVTFLLIELPVIQLLKLVFKRPANQH